MVILLAPVLLFPERLAPAAVSLALFVLVLLWCVRLWATGYVLAASPLEFPILCLLLTVPLSLYATANFATSLPTLTGLLFGIALYGVVARHATDERSRPVVLNIWLASAVAIALVSLVGTDWALKSGFLNALTGRLPHVSTALTSTAQGGLNPNEVGGLMALFVPLVGSVVFMRQTARRNDPSSIIGRALSALRPPSPVGRIVWGLALLLFSGLLVLTQSRSAMFGTGIAAILIAGARYRLVRVAALGA
ncbi:MAG: hypothetical protein HYR71_00825, partial [Chloroflexi bacterium]|nr:hypothetical protein [Chloroflexota bacterium]